MTQEQITAAGIGSTTVNEGTLARRITVPGTVVPHADRIARVSVRLSATVAELAYPCTLFLVFSLPAPVGLGAPLQRMQIAGAILLVAAVTALNVVKRRDVIRAPRRQARLVPTDEVA